MNVLHLLGACLVSSVSGLAPVRHNLQTYDNDHYFMFSTYSDYSRYVYTGSSYAYENRKRGPQSVTIPYEPGTLYSQLTFVKSKGSAIPVPSHESNVPKFEIVEETHSYSKANTTRVDAPYWCQYQTFYYGFTDNTDCSYDTFDFIIAEHYLYDENDEWYYYFRNYAVGPNLVDGQHFVSVEDSILGTYYGNDLTQFQVDVGLTSSGSYATFFPITNNVVADYGYVSDSGYSTPRDYMADYLALQTSLVPNNNLPMTTYFNDVILGVGDSLEYAKGYLYPFVIFIADSNGYPVEDDLFGNSSYYKYLRCSLDYTDVDNLVYNSAYNEGLNAGKTQGYNSGYNDGKTDGYQEGYNVGLNATDYNFMNLFGAIADTPVLIIRNLFSFDLFGVSALTVVLTLFTALVVIYIAKKIL